MSENVTIPSAPIITYAGYRVFTTDGHKEYTSGTWSNIDTSNTLGTSIVSNTLTLIMSRSGMDGEMAYPLITIADVGSTAHGANYYNVMYDAISDYMSTGRIDQIGMVQSASQTRSNILYTLNGKYPSPTESSIFKYYEITPGTLYPVPLNSFANIYGVPFDSILSNMTGEYTIIRAVVLYEGKYSAEARVHLKIVD